MLAYLTSLVIRKVAKEADVGNVCNSTEELISTFEAYNKDRIKNGFHEKKVIIGSMDIKKWYPIIDEKFEEIV